jgi:hypothetical protein
MKIHIGADVDSGGAQRERDRRQSGGHRRIAQSAARERPGGVRRCRLRQRPIQARGTRLGDDLARPGQGQAQEPAPAKAGGSLGAALSGSQKKRNRRNSGIRARVEHPFRIVKRQFGYTKVRYRGLAKNAAQVMTLIGLANLYALRGRLAAA